MNTLKRKIIWNQALLFIYVVVILGLPYLWLSADLSKSQVRPFLIIYFLQAVFLLGVFLALPLQWARPLLSLERAIAGKGEFEPARVENTLKLAASMPTKLALAIFCVGYVVSLIGVLTMRLKAHFTTVQCVQALLVGLMLGLIYSLFTLFTLEGILVRVMSEAMARLPRRVSLKGMPLSQKLFITCGSLVLIAVLFVSSISFVESKKAVESQAMEVQRIQLRLAASAQNWGSMIEGESGGRLVETMQGLQLGGVDRLSLISNTGFMLASIPQGMKPVLPAGLLNELFMGDKTVGKNAAGNLIAEHLVNRLHIALLMEFIEKRRLSAPEELDTCIGKFFEKTPEGKSGTVQVGSRYFS